ncbi:TatD family hydrolase [Halobacillus sp. Marseille-P3879]|uniref:TatD family hydrolase n=1 Tax=Halobacillus sp. Marseille-P3879 TaxID=2045014 RepID=UPI000C7E4EF2|nr:TatD family hydrolase [Halobacillus sp. Marseille-P3879]
MVHSVIDAHIHLDWYARERRERILQETRLHQIDGLISVSSNLDSCYQNLDMADKKLGIYPAVGFHPEQPLPGEHEIEEIITLIDQQSDQLTAIGEVGLPYYLRQENPAIDLGPYIEILEQFMKKAAWYNKPLALHSIYEDADVTCNFLEKHSIKKAHFHWFKGGTKTIERMKSNRYFVSITPDCLYKEKTQQLIRLYPLELLMVETDGPWEFFKSEWTHPKMLHHSVKKISELKRIDLESVYKQLYKNTCSFYHLPHV